MDFSTMKDKIRNNDYNTVTEFKVRMPFKALPYFRAKVGDGEYLLSESHRV